MSLLSLVFVAQTLSASDLAPSGFFVAGVRQGMSMSEYERMISNGGFRSQAVSRDTQWAAINGQDVFVRFCGGIIIGATAGYSSSDWMRALRTLEGLGFRWGVPVVTVENDELRSGTVAFTTTVPRGFTYGVMPTIKAADGRGRDFPGFMLNFEALEHACR